MESTLQKPALVVGGTRGSHHARASQPRPADPFALNGKPCLPGGSQFEQSLAPLNAARSARRRRDSGRLRGPSGKRTQK